MARETDQLAAMEESMDADSSSDAELLPSPAGRRKRPSVWYSVAIGSACIAGLLGLTAMVAASDFTPRGHSAKAVVPLTVRSLMEGHELADIATDNILAIGGATEADGKPMTREAVRGKVHESMKNIKDLIAAKDPKALEKMGNLTLTPEQKEKAMKLLSKFGDSRMVKLTKEVKNAMEEHRKEGGDDRRLMEKVQQRLFPHAADIRALAEELYPGKEDNSIDIPFNKGGWHGEVEVNFGRRLAVSDVETVGGVTTQARTLFKGLEDELGDAMPKAPARILFSLSDDTYSVAGQPQQPAQQGKPSFMDCLKKAVPNPIEVCSCIASNMSEVMSMMMNFMKGGSNNAAR